MTDRPPFEQRRRSPVSGVGPPPFQDGWRKQGIFIALAASMYAGFYFAILGLPAIGVPFIRIDYVATSVTLWDEWSEFLAAVAHSRPVSGAYASLQATLARILLDGDTRYIIYPLQHISLLAYFVAIARVLEYLFSVRLRLVPLLSAWILFSINPAALAHVYKLETIVGTLSMLFGSLSMVLLVRWEQRRHTLAGLGFLAAYGLSVLAKEDFALPPLLLLGWMLLRDGWTPAEIIRSARSRGWLIAGLVGVVAFFFIFNHLLITGRAFIEPVKRLDSPYYMTLALPSLFKVAVHYVTGMGRNGTTISILYGGASLLALLFSRKRWETLLVASMVAGLMLPYLIMPNHIFDYYSVKWVAFQAITFAFLAQMLLDTKPILGSALAAAGAATVVLPTLLGVAARSDLMWHQGGFFKKNFTVARNINESLIRRRESLNRHAEIGVLGLGPGKILNTPWGANGKSAFHLSELGLTPRWIIFVERSGSGYTVDRRGSSTSPVEVRQLSELEAFRGFLLVFDEKGVGRLEPPGVVRSQRSDAASSHPFRKWVLSPGMALQASPQTIECVPGTRPSVDISWDMTAQASGQKVRIWVAKGDSRKLWRIDNAKGSARTGAWAQGGLRFDLEDPASHQLLASMTLGGMRCR